MEISSLIVRTVFQRTKSWTWCGENGTDGGDYYDDDGNFAVP